MKTVNSCHDPRNPKSGRVMRKCGMTREGTWRGGGVNNQGICDEVWYSVLREEHEENAQRAETVRQVTEPEVFPTLWDPANPCQIYVMGI